MAIIEEEQILRDKRTQGASDNVQKPIDACDLRRMGGEQRR
jgi:hypothetical protein